MKKIITVLIFSLVLSGCGNQEVTNKNTGTTSEKSGGKCATGAVDLVNYTDKGKRLANCFVEYPGEPSRQDKSYYIIEDICGQFTKEFMANVLGQQIVRAEASAVPIVASCSYYLNDKDYVMAILDYLSVENQKKGLEILGRKVVVDDRIPMENFYALQENGLINSIYLVLNQDKFIRLERSNAKVLEGDLVLQFAARLAEQIKSYK